MLGKPKNVLLFCFTALLIISTILIVQVEKSDPDRSSASIPVSSNSKSPNLATSLIGDSTPPQSTRSASDRDLDRSQVFQETTLPAPSPGVENSDINPENKVSSTTEPESERSFSEPEAPRLSPRVRAVIEEAQRRLMAQQVEEALNEMNALYAEFDDLSPFEQATLLNFYTNALLMQEMWQESITAFSLMRTIPDLRTDIDSRAGLSLGQLYSRVGEHDVAVHYYQEWLDNPYGEERTAEQTERVTQLLADAESVISN